MFYYKIPYRSIKGIFYDVYISDIEVPSRKEYEISEEEYQAWHLEQKKNVLEEETGIKDSAQSLVALCKKFLLSPENLVDVTDNEKIEFSGLIEDWVIGKYEVGELRNVNNQTWECFAAHDSEILQDITPEGAAWQTFWRPMHGTVIENAKQWVAPQGSHDMYHPGEYMWFTDFKLYKCLMDTNFSPIEYAQAWEMIKELED